MRCLIGKVFAAPRNLVLAAIMGVVLASPFRAGATVDVFTVSVGYADNLRPYTVGFPVPFQGSPQTTFIGSSDSVGGYDAGVVAISSNAGNTIPFSITSLVVDVPTIASYNIWIGSPIFQNPANWVSGKVGVLDPGQTAVFTQTNGDNFDTSDTGLYYGNSPGVSNGIIPTVTVGLGIIGEAGDFQLTYQDNVEVLNTGGFDPDANESTPYRLIGESGIYTPYTPTPEPPTWLLIGIGIISMAFKGVRRRRDLMPPS